MHVIPPHYSSPRNTGTVYQDAEDYDEVKMVPPRYSSPHNTDTHVNSTSKDTSTSYQHLMMPLNPEHAYAVTSGVLENEKRGSDGRRLASDPKGEVKEKSGYQELQMTKKPDAEYTRLNIQL